jgi:aryl-alcohol dehydrogenase-like predicted oxidoreductase
MRYKLLGHTGLRVAEFALGTMTFGEEWGWGAAPKTSRKIFEAYAEAGGNFIDTADIYTDGTSEKLVGEFVAAERERFVVATKYTNSAVGRDPNAAGNHRKNLVQSLETSLRRLQLDYVDLFWLHAWDFTTSPEEVMRAFDDQVRAGKVLYIGISDTPAWIVAQADTLARLRGWTRPAAIQVEYSLVERTAERELLPMAHGLDLGITAWSPLGSGLLTGKYTRPAQKKAQRRLDQAAFKEIDDVIYSIAREVDRVADEVGRPSSQVALNWLRRQAGVIPIVGARTLDQFRENLATLEFELVPEQMERLNKVSQIELGFPHDFLNSEVPRNFLYGGMIDQIDRHR